MRLLDFQCAPRSQVAKTLKDKAVSLSKVKKQEKALNAIRPRFVQLGQELTRTRNRQTLTEKELSKAREVCLGGGQGRGRGEGQERHVVLVAVCC